MVKDWFYRQQARYLYRQALTQIRKGNVEAALRVLPRALGHHAHPAHLYVELGKAYWHTGDLAAALTALSDAIALDPACVVAYGNRGLLYCQRGRDDLALADWGMALDHQPHHALIHYNRGLLHHRRGDCAAALADLDAAIAANPNLAEAYLHRGNIYEQLGQGAAAARDWELALCNDLNLDQARSKLQGLQQAHRDRLLADRLRAGLALPQVDLTVQHQEDHLCIYLRRPVGVGLNYFTLPDRLRALILDWQMDDIQSFELIAQAQAVVEWQGRYKLFHGQPCPPARWHRVLLTAFVIFPPLGIPALACAMNLRQAYQQGDYLGALRASKTIQGLCRAGGIISLTLVTLTAGYWGYERFYGESEAAASPKYLVQPSPLAPADSVD